ncbi:exosortase-associated protein EpsI, B-type [Niveibacterium terrae]|uniref:exosortase-associated protein EpsI, B-type n=1 Tax=Niveibacterium terrae TaxID=3373598 RepID=UPI003A90AD97
MSVELKRALLACLVMLCSAALAFGLTPRDHLADHQPLGSIEKIIPRSFGAWRLDQRIEAIPSVSVSRELSVLYSQTLTRAYVRADGYRVMLSIAYGGDQTRELQVHRPEVCYAAQGFRIGKLQKAWLGAAGQALPVMRLQTELGARKEPVTYWVRIGEKVVRGNVEQGIARLTYGLHGQIPDGLLFRVSSIDGNPDLAYRVQQEFVKSLFDSLSPEQRRMFAGGKR